jgi:hypothetical protein
MAKFMKMHSSAMDMDPTQVPKLFVHFMNQNRQHLLNPVVLPDGNVRAAWLDIKTDPSQKKKSSSISLSNHKPKGLAIYVDESDPKLYRHSIPLSEIYTEMVKIYNDDTQHTDLPFRFLSQLMYCFYYAAVLSDECPASDQDILRKNATDLEGFIHEEVSSSSEVTKGGFMDQIGGMLGKLNINGALQGLQKNLGGLMSSDMASNVGDVFKELQENVSGTSNFAEGLSKTFESQKVQKVFGHIQDKVKEFMPSEEKIERPDIDPSIQE